VNNYLTACREHQFPVLLASMRRHCRPFHLFVFALDWEHTTSDPDATVICRHDFFCRHPRYEKLPGPPRLPINIIDAARWRVMADLLGSGFRSITYVDGDQWFFSPPQPMHDEIAGARLAVSPHRIPAPEENLPGITLATHRQYGLYNSGLVHVSDVEIAEEMARATFFWSYSSVIPLPDGSTLFGDQGHLEVVAKRHRAHVIQHPGVNVAPWNAHRYRPTVVDGQVQVGGAPLVTYHFHGLRWEAGRLVELVGPGYALPDSYLRPVYEPYLAALASGGRAA
jgi:hypothetical protein